MANEKLKPYVHQNNQSNLKKAQKKYKAWHDKRNNAKEIKLYEGQNVVVFRKDKWIPGKVVKKADTPKSYWIKIGIGNIIRRNI